MSRVVALDLIGDVIDRQSPKNLKICKWGTWKKGFSINLDGDN